jgi:hypothetical protein
MPLPKAKMPTNIGDVRMTLIDLPSGERSLTWAVQVLSEAGEVIETIATDLTEFLNPGEEQMLGQLLNRLRTRAGQDILNPGGPG